MFSYQVCDNGAVIKTSRKHYIESEVKPYFRRGNVWVKINGKEYLLKRLVAEHFLGLEPDERVRIVDGNHFNCSVENLEVLHMTELGERTGHLARSRKVKINGVEYRSVRECAKALHCSYQTLLDYMNGKIKHSVLQGMSAEYVEDITA
jgi:hypothetical protein